MKKENILSYCDVETILNALALRAMDERAQAEKERKDGDEECAGYHDEQANECSRVIAKLRAFVF
jgi:hypothetical protein